MVVITDMWMTYLLFIAICPSNIDLLLKVFNEYHSKLKFTIELGDGRLNFLDITIIKKNNYSHEKKI